MCEGQADLCPQQEDGCGPTVVKAECPQCVRLTGCVLGESVQPPGAGVRTGCRGANIRGVLFPSAFCEAVTRISVTQARAHRAAALEPPGGGRQASSHRRAGPRDPVPAGLTAPRGNHRRSGMGSLGSDSVS